MTLKEVKTEALKLSEEEREALIQDLRESLEPGRRRVEDDPIWGLGTSPVDLGVTDASVAHDRYLYGTLSD